MYEHGTCASSSPRQSGPRAAADPIPPRWQFDTMAGVR